MGRRSGVETAVAILAAFHREATWEQAALAREVGVQVRALRSALDECVRQGMPIERDPENRSRVFWSVPAWWSRRLDDEEVRACIRLVSRLPPSRARNRLLERLLRGDVGTKGPASAAERALEAVEDALGARVALRMRYDAASAFRYASVQRIDHGDRTRFVAVCHRSRSLKIFRADRVREAVLDPTEPFLSPAPGEVEAFVRDALDGYHGDERAGHYLFFVRDPEARWVSGALPAGDVRVERVDGGIRVSAHTSARVVLARFLVGLGDAVRIETATLRESVAELARLSLAAHEPRAKPLGGAGGRNSAGRWGNGGSRGNALTSSSSSSSVSAPSSSRPPAPFPRRG